MPKPASPSCSVEFIDMGVKREREEVPRAVVFVYTYFSPWMLLGHIHGAPHLSEREKYSTNLLQGDERGDQRRAGSSHGFDDDDGGPKVRLAPCSTVDTLPLRDLADFGARRALVRATTQRRKVRVDRR